MDALCVEAVAAMVLLLAFIGFLASLCLVVVLGRRYQAIRLLLHIIDALLLAPQVMHLGIGYCYNRSILGCMAEFVKHKIGNACLECSGALFRRLCQFSRLS